MVSGAGSLNLPDQKRVYRMHESRRIIEHDVVIAVGNLGQFGLRAARFHFSENLRRDTRTVLALDQ